MRSHAVGNIRPSPIAGRWYPGQPKQLVEVIDRMLNAAPSISVRGPVCGLIVPHAGYLYSGPIAARAFKAVQGKNYDRVVVVAPMHHPYPDPLLTTSHDAYETPLGTIPVDRDVLNSLSQKLPFTPVRNDPEHSLEIELPFIQHTLSGSFRLVPLMLRDQSYEAAELIARALVDVIGPDPGTLLVASSDLSHFYSAEAARSLDSYLMELISQNDPAGIIRADDTGKAFACGRGAIATILLTAAGMGATGVQVTGYGTSGDVTSDYERVVGYGSAVIYR